jgi:hypothetical protein
LEEGTKAVEAAWVPAVGVGVLGTEPVVDGALEGATEPEIQGSGHDKEANCLQSAEEQLSRHQNARVQMQLLLLTLRDIYTDVSVGVNSNLTAAS